MVQDFHSLLLSLLPLEEQGRLDEAEDLLLFLFSNEEDSTIIRAQGNWSRLDDGHTHAHSWVVRGRRRVLEGCGNRQQRSQLADVGSEGTPQEELSFRIHGACHPVIDFDTLNVVVQ